MKFITFSGVDGSGKSTQLELLKEHLERENWNVAYFHAVSFSLANRLMKRLHATCHSERVRESRNPEEKTRSLDRLGMTEEKKAVTEASWLTIFLRKAFLFIDMLRFRCLLRRLKKENCDYLLSDRYFFDSIINIEFLSRKNWKLEIGNWKLLAKPDIALYFDVSPETIMSRDRAPEQGIDYLRAKQALFNQKFPEWNLTIIDANRDKETVFQEILKKI